MVQAPVALSLTAALWGLGALTGSLLHGPGPLLRQAVGVGVPSLAVGAWWSPLTSLLWCANLASYLVATLLLLAVLFPVERRFGSARTLVLLVLAQGIGMAVAGGLLTSTASVSDLWAQRMATDLAVGPAGAVLGVALGVSAQLDSLWRRRLRLVLLVGLATAALYSGSWQDVSRLATGLAGLAVGMVPLVWRSAPTAQRRSQRPSPWPAAGTRARRRWAATGPEVRTLVALVVAASAAGPVFAALSGSAGGPLSVLRYLVLDPAPDATTVQALCADPAVVEDCADLRLRLRIGGAGPAVLSLLPVLVALLLADGLRRGRRFAWWGSLGLQLVFAGLAVSLAVLTSAVPAERLVTFGPNAAAGGSSTALVAAAAHPLAVVALLLVTRRRFAVTAPARVLRRWAAAVGAAFVASSLVYLLGGYVVRDGFFPQPGWAQLAADLPTRFLPVGYLGQVEVAIAPVGWAASWLFGWIGVLFWAVALGSALRVLRHAPSVPDDAAAARELLCRHGGSTLSWLTTWRGQRYWLDHTGRAGIAYRVIGGVALSTGEPFGKAPDRLGAVDGFARFCAEHAWTPCLYSVGAPVRDHLEQRGWASLQVAEETVLALPELRFTGRRWQDVRSALNNARKADICAEWVDYTSAPAAIADQIRGISEDWVAEKGLPEMGFTLGGLDELADPQVRCLLAVDADRTVHGATSWLPVYADGQVVGWTLDFMRRRDGGFRPVMEFLIASAVLAFQEEGAQFVSLSGAPLARRDRGERPDGLQRLLDRLGETLEPVYGFQSLLAFKAKFQPEYRPLYLAYPDPGALPAIAAAITRAYLPDLTARRALNVLRRLRRPRREPAPPPASSPPARPSEDPAAPGRRR
ncbi:bifunctional lysylphosphatidylglycerol flippase/synthetase MprF [Pseudonocardia sp. RS010]|uniref:bifunctional lysylphosphatidylglycerol flippase/synthetase MprF n=1 Tax=Pseudonocardia sp. RS010 TaxID=3385979 RepID=UPI00399EF6A7